MDRVLARYAKTEHYEDTGFVVAESDQSSHRIQFQTKFDRGAGLTFAFWSDDERPPGEPARSLLTVDSSGRARTRLGLDRPELPAESASVLDATAELQGVSRLASIVVPRLLYGLKICSCAERSEVVPLAQADGTKGTSRVIVRPDDTTEWALTVDSNYEIVRVEVRRTNAEHGLRLSINYQRVDFDAARHPQAL